MEITPGPLLANINNPDDLKNWVKINWLQYVMTYVNI